MRAFFTVIISLLLSLSLLLQGCYTPAYLFKKEKYQKLVELNLKAGLRGKLKIDEIGYFIDGFNAWHFEVKKELALLYQSNRYKDWLEGLKRIHKVEVIQAKVSGFPQIDTQSLLFIKIEDWKIRFKDQIYAHHLQRYEQLLKDYAVTDNRRLIQAAYFEINKIEAFALRPNPDDIAKRRAYCLEQGHRFILIEYDKGHFVSERHFDYFVAKVYPESDEWNTFLERVDAPRVDYHLQISLDRIDSDYSGSTTRTYHSKEIVARYETEKDTAGNTIRTPIYETVNAEVITTEYEYESSGRASFLLTNKRKQEKAQPFDFYSSCTDDCEEVRTSGDTRALPSPVFCSSCSASLYSYNSLEEDVLNSLARKVLGFLDEI